LGQLFLSLGRRRIPKQPMNKLFGHALLLDPCMSKVVVLLCLQECSRARSQVKTSSSTPNDPTHPVHRNFIKTIVIIILRRDEISLLC
jgi:hypothetical protein